METFCSMKKEHSNIFPTWLGRCYNRGIRQKETLILMKGLLLTKSLEKLKIVLDFRTKEMTIDEITLPMQDVTSLSTKSKMYKAWKMSNSLRMENEPASTLEATRWCVKILDANYKKADLPFVVKDNCSHLSPDEQAKLLEFLMEYEDLFDGTLGDWKTEPVSFVHGILVEKVFEDWSLKSLRSKSCLFSSSILLWPHSSGKSTAGVFDIWNNAPIVVPIMRSTFCGEYEIRGCLVPPWGYSTFKVGRSSTTCRLISTCSLVNVSIWAC